MEHKEIERIRHARRQPRWYYLTGASYFIILLSRITPSFSQDSSPANASIGIDETLSRSPSPLPSDPNDNVTGSPSAVISFSPMSAMPVSLPSLIPLESAMPSFINTSQSSSPASIANSTLPVTTKEPSSSPTTPPSSMPIRSKAPISIAPSSVSPPALEIIDSPFFSMSLLGMEMNVESSELFTREWRNLMSQHVLQFWLSYGSSAPFQVERVITHFLEESRRSNEDIPADEKLHPTSGGTDEANSGLSRTERPDPLTITYRQDIFVYLPIEIDSEYPDLTKVTIFTIPFELDGRNFTESLRAMSNNSQLIFLEYHGVVDDPTPLTVSSRQGKKIIAIVVTVVTLSLIGASTYIFYLMRLKDHHPGGEVVDYGATDAPPATHPVDGQSPKLRVDDGTTPLVGSFIGSSRRDNVLVSESYDEEFKVRVRPADLLVGHDPEPSIPLDYHTGIPQAQYDVASSVARATQSDSKIPIVDQTLIHEPNHVHSNTVDDEVAPSREHLSTEDSPFPSLPFTPSDVESGEMSDYYVINYSTDEHSYRSSSSLGSQNNDVLQSMATESFSPSSPAGLPRTVDYVDGNYNGHEVRTESEEEMVVFEEHIEESHHPFVQSGFQIEIRDLE